MFHDQAKREFENRLNAVRSRVGSRVDVAQVVRTVDKQAEQNTAWLGMLTYLAAMPVAAVAAFVLYIGAF